MLFIIGYVKWEINYKHINKKTISIQWNTIDLLKERALNVQQKRLSNIYCPSEKSGMQSSAKYATIQ